MFKEVWWELYKNVILGTDRTKLDEFILEAEQAIRGRFRMNGQISHDDKIALRDALAALAVVKRETPRSSRPAKFYEN